MSKRQPPVSKRAAKSMVVQCTTTRRCHYCGQTLPEYRLGVRLSPLKARIFDMVMRSGKGGVLGDDLFTVAFAERRAEKSVLKSHVQQINREIAPTGYRIRVIRQGNGMGLYLLIGPNEAST